MRDHESAQQQRFGVTWIGHSTLLIAIDGLNILVDPIWSDRASPVSFAGPKRIVAPGISLEDLPDIDIVLITHNHYDHLDRRTVRQLGNVPQYLVPPGVGKHLRKWGIHNVIERGWWKSEQYGAVTVTGTPARHFSSRTLFDRNRTQWCGWAIRGSSGSVFVAGDTGYFDGFTEIGTRLGPFDLACLPIGAYLPRLFMAPIHMSPDEALDAFHDLGARQFLAIHWGTFRLAADPPLLAPSVLRRSIEARGLDPARFWILKHGETRLVSSIHSSASTDLMKGTRS